MGLITKPPDFRHCTASLSAPSTTVIGTAINADANDADGTDVAFLTALTHDVEYLLIGINGVSAAGGNGSALLDILVDPAGGTTWASAPLINDLLAGQSGAATTTSPIAVWYHFPIWLKSGHSIGGRMRTAHTSQITAGEVAIIAYGGNTNPASWWCGQHVTTIGVDDTISQGTNHTAGVSGAFSAWANFGSTLPAPCGALQFGVHGTNTDTTQAATAYIFEFGIASTRIGPSIFRSTNTNEAGWTSPTGPIFYSAPSGAQLQVRAACQAVSAEAIDVAAYVVS
jgi:hypothetical protein